MVVGPFLSRVCIGLVKLVAVDLVLHVASEDHGQRNAGRHHGTEKDTIYGLKVNCKLSEVAHPLNEKILVKVFQYAN